MAGDLVEELRAINRNYDLARGVHITVGQAADRIAALEAEAGRLRELAITLHGALAAHTCFGCPQCPGDCSSANPPVFFCPTQQAISAYRMFDAAALERPAHD